MLEVDSELEEDSVFEEALDTEEELVEFDVELVAVPHTKTYSKTPAHEIENIVHPSLVMVMFSDPDPDLVPDQDPPAWQEEAREDQDSSICEPTETLS